MPSETTNQNLRLTAWLISLLSAGLAIAVWWQSFGGNVKLSNYTLFPLFGLMAFSLMWGHYVVGALRRYFAVPKQALKSYYKTTSWAVLFFILLHPGLFIYQLWADGYGVPPNSYKSYVAATAVWAIMLGTIAFFIFLMFETKKVFGKNPWWKLVEYAQILAMVLIYVHALKLGGELQTEWYKTVWVFYGLSFVISVMYNFVKDRGEK